MKTKKKMRSKEKNKMTDGEKAMFRYGIDQGRKQMSNIVFAMLQRLFLDNNVENESFNDVCAVIMEKREYLKGLDNLEEEVKEDEK